MIARRTKLLLTSLLCCVFLGACGIKPIKVDTVAQQKTPLALPNPEPVTMLPVKFILITPENASAVFAGMKAKKYDLVLIGMPAGSYKNMSLNMAELKKYIIEQNGIIAAYKKYYEPEAQNQTKTQKR